MIPNTMMAWVLNSPGVLQLKEVEVPRIREDQVLIEIDRACICNGSDPGIFHGHEAYQTPLIFGHEASGRMLRKENGWDGSSWVKGFAGGLKQAHLRSIRQ